MVVLHVLPRHLSEAHPVEGWERHRHCTADHSSVPFLPPLHCRPALCVS